MNDAYPGKPYDQDSGDDSQEENWWWQWGPTTTYEDIERDTVGTERRIALEEQLRGDGLWIDESAQ